MGKTDINDNEFDESTKLKLEIFGDCFNEWFPVFLNNKWIEKVYIFDFFAGSGKDANGNFGSPLILKEKARGYDRKYCKNKKKDVSFIFNEGLKKKSKELQKNVEEHTKNCKNRNTCNECIYNYHVRGSLFQDIFSGDYLKGIFRDKKIGKFILLDQYGFSQVDEGVFKELVSYPKTDFIFFISSSFIARFKDHTNTKKFFDTSKIDTEDPRQIHRQVADYFKSLIPQDKEYYIHNFSIKKGANYYGLILGSGHTLGMEKFLNVCWRKDQFSGEANYKIDGDFGEGTLFYNTETTNKKDKVGEDLEKLILSGGITDSITGFKLAMREGCKPKLFTDLVKKLEREKRIKLEGKLSYQSTSIHQIKEPYKIKLLNHGT